MTLGPKGIALIKSWETFQIVGYLPTPNDKPTIGWGHTGADVQVGDVVTPQEAGEYFLSDTAWVQAAVLNGLKVEVTQDQFDALCCLVFNIGPEAWRTSTVLKKINGRESEEEIEKWWKVWNLQAGKVLKGLVVRREAEWELFTTGVLTEAAMALLSPGQVS